MEVALGEIVQGRLGDELRLGDVTERAKPV
jgi:hypothetical protein